MIRSLNLMYSKLFYAYYLLFVKINWLKYYNLKNKASKNIVWLFPLNFTIKNYFSYIKDNAFLNDLALINSFIEDNKDFNVFFGTNIGKFSDKKIFYTISKSFNLFGLSNHSFLLNRLGFELENQGNVLYPSPIEANLWENKAYMHDLFEKVQINTPKTIIVDVSKVNINTMATVSYPLLLKECHSSGSLGVIKVNNFEHLEMEILKRRYLGQNTFIIQELLNIKKDLRVILVGNKIVLHYWRINQSDEWKPTSTSHGSNVDFVFFPEKWRSKIIEAFEKLDISTGAFDIAWNNDDLESDPYFLEVSPAYMPNPQPSIEFMRLSYSDYKKKIFPRPKYLIDYIDVVFKIKKEVFINYYHQEKV